MAIILCVVGAGASPDGAPDVRRSLADHAVTIVAVLVLVTLFALVAYTFIFSFNDSAVQHRVSQGRPRAQDQGPVRRAR